MCVVLMVVAAVLAVHNILVYIYNLCIHICL